MANKHFNRPELMPPSGGRPGPPKRGPKEKAFSPDPMKTAAWPGLPGKTQPKDRSNGVPRLKNAHVKSEGI